MAKRITNAQIKSLIVRRRNLATVPLAIYFVHDGCLSKIMKRAHWKVVTFSSVHRLRVVYMKMRETRIYRARVAHQPDKKWRRWPPTGTIYQSRISVEWKDALHDSSKFLVRRSSIFIAATMPRESLLCETFTKCIACYCRVVRRNICKLANKKPHKEQHDFVSLDIP